jgi:hypothetical protein
MTAGISPPQLPDSVLRLFIAAQRIAEQTPDFFKTKGPGLGDHASLAFMAALRKISEEIFGAKCLCEHRVCTGAAFAVDFYFPDEATVVEVALSLDKPISEYERDILKCLLAKDRGCAVRKLLFITKPGGHRKNNAPGPQAIARFVREKFGLEIEILEMHPLETNQQQHP